jgi:uncharacterized coiled-coil protein SlyX
MSSQNTDERIAQLEKKVAQLLQLQDEGVKTASENQRAVAALFNLVLVYAEDNLLAMRFIAENPAFGNEEIRQRIRDAVSHQESSVDRTRAVVLGIISKMSKSPSEPPAS